MAGDLSQIVNTLENDAFQALHGRWDPLEPAAAVTLLAAADVRWYVAGGRAARVGAIWVRRSIARIPLADAFLPVPGPSY